MADLEATNGVVHVIDSVLVPSDFEYVVTDMMEELPKTGEISLIPFVLLGILSLGGYSLMNKKQ